MQKNDNAWQLYATALQSSLVIFKPAVSPKIKNNIPGVTNILSLINRQNLFALLLLICFLPNTGKAQTTPIINSKLVGRVIDSKTKETLAGASVSIKGTTHSVATDGDGRFNFITGQKFPYTLTISYIGYKTQELVVDGSPVEVRLEATANSLNDVVVVGYGVQQRKNLVGSVSKIDPATTKTIPEGSFDAQLQGKAAGVQINSNIGVPGSDIYIRVRGATSINASNSPLYVIDGVFANNGTLQSIAQDRATSPLADINPADIQSIEILKDAVAIAIYGSRGANGVVIVTTKRGNYGQKTKIELSASQGFGKAPADRVWKTTTGPEHAMLVNEYSRNMGKPEPFRPVDQVIRGLPSRRLDHRRLAMKLGLRTLGTGDHRE